MTEAVPKDRLVEWLNEPIEGATGGVTRYLYDIWRTRDDLRRAFPDPTGKDGARLVEWAQVHGRTEVPIPPALLPPAPRSARRRSLPAGGRRSVHVVGKGVNLAGFLRSDLGIGEAARLTISALDAQGIPVLPLDVGGMLPSSRIGEGHDFLVADGSPPIYPVNLICVNGQELISATSQLGPALFEGRYSIGLWWWEVLGGTPTHWLPAALFLDEVWAASRHVADAIRGFSPVPVEQVTLPVTLPPPPAHLDREALGLPEGFLFLSLFDYYSALERKNPAAAVSAFRKAFPPGSGASLVVKSTNSHSNPQGRRKLLEAAQGHPDIHFLDRYLSADEKNAMLAASDCYVSLHRSEGFGLPLAEAMYLGKPAIATGFSGNLEYMTPQNSYLVDYELIEVGEHGGHYSGAGKWAEPSTAHAAELMLHVFEHQEEARARGALGSDAIRRHHSPEVAGKEIERHLERIAETGRSGDPGAGALRAPEAQPAAAPARRPLRAIAARVPGARPVVRAARRSLPRRPAASRAQVEELRRAVQHLEGLMAAEAAQRAALLAAVRRQDRALLDLDGRRQ